MSRTPLAVAVTSATFDAEVLQSAIPVLVDVWATWCPPCRRLIPIIDAIAEKFAGRVKVVKCDFDSNPDLSQRYNVQSIPNLLFFRDGQLVDRHLGFSPAAELAEKVEGVLAK